MEKMLTDCGGLKSDIMTEEEFQKLAQKATTEKDEKRKEGDTMTKWDSVEIENAKRLLYGLPNILRSQIDLFDLDEVTWNESQIFDMISRHEMLSDVLHQVTVNVEEAIRLLNDAEKIIPDADKLKEGALNG